MHGIDHAVCEGTNGFAVFYGTLDDLVVNVGDVANVRDLVATGLEPALDHIKGDIGTSVPHMAQVIDGHAANVHADMPRLKWRKIGNGAGERVVDAQAHESLFLLFGCKKGPQPHRYCKDGLDTGPPLQFASV